MPSTIRDRLGAYWRLARFDRPTGIYLLLWPTWWALWFAAEGDPPLTVLIVFTLGTALMRAAGCVVNDYADRGFDPHVARTRQRPLASGEVSPREALWLFVALCLSSLLLLLGLGNPLAIALSVPAVLLAASYPFTKRFFAMPQAVLGVAFSWGIPMAYAAVRDEVVWREVLPLMAANLAWVIAYDTWYAMVDRTDDLRIGVKSSAIAFARYDRLAVALLDGLALSILLGLGLADGRGEPYFAGIAAASLLAARHQWITRDRDPAACFRAFLGSHWMGFAVFAGLALDFEVPGLA